MEGEQVHALVHQQRVQEQHPQPQTKALVPVAEQQLRSEAPDQVPAHQLQSEVPDQVLVQLQQQQEGMEEDPSSEEQELQHPKKRTVTLIPDEVVGQPPVPTTPEEPRMDLELQKSFVQLDDLISLPIEDQLGERLSPPLFDSPSAAPRPDKGKEHQRTVQPENKEGEDEDPETSFY